MRAKSRPQYKKLVGRREYNIIKYLFKCIVGLLMLFTNTVYVYG